MPLENRTKTPIVEIGRQSNNCGWSHLTFFCPVPQVLSFRADVVPSYSVFPVPFFGGCAMSESTPELPVSNAPVSQGPSLLAVALRSMHTNNPFYIISAALILYGL